MPPRKRAASAPDTTTTAPEPGPAGDRLPRQRSRPAKRTAAVTKAKTAPDVVELPDVPEPIPVPESVPAPKIAYGYAVGSRVWVDIAYLDEAGPPEVQHVGSVVERRPNETGSAAEYRLSGLPGVWVPAFRVRSV